MAEIDADYLGGDPDQAQAPVLGKLAFTTGEMGFTGTSLVGMTTRRIPGPTLTPEQIKAISVGDANAMRALTRGAAGAMLGGAIGGLIGMATGRRNTLFVVAAERDGFAFAATFGATGRDAQWLLDQVQRGRRDRGEPPLPKLEEMSRRAAATLEEQQASLLLEIRNLLEAQNELLRRALDRIPGEALSEEGR